MNSEDSQAAIAQQVRAAPIFVVGSPRSGTSILTWCLGQHTNILPLEESAWMGDFATDVGVRHAQGCQRGERSQLEAMGITQEEFFAAFGTAVDRLILRHRDALERNSASAGAHHPAECHVAFQIARAAEESKSRWVNGTPEYSLHICALKKMFPAAKFVHIVRDVVDVVASMLNIRRIAKMDLVATAQQAYEYWLRTTQACLQAEQALGPHEVHRLRYADLIAQPGRMLRETLDFLGEPYQPACIEPLIKRINSSQVPRDFRIDHATVDSETLARAEQLSRLLQQPLPALAATPLALTEFEAAFDERVRFVTGLDAEYQVAQTVVAQLDRDLEERTAWAHQLDNEISVARTLVSRLQRERDERTAWAQRLDQELHDKTATVAQLRRSSNNYAVLFFLQLLTGIVACTGEISGGWRHIAILCWFGLSLVAGGLFVWTRRAGLFQLGASIVARFGRR